MTATGGGRGKTPGWAGESLVACVDGPMAGQWHTAADWAERLAAAQRMTAKRQPATAVDAYRPTGVRVGHPHVLDAEGAAWSIARSVETPSTTGVIGHDADVLQDVDVDRDADLDPAAADVDADADADGWVW